MNVAEQEIPREVAGLQACLEGVLLGTAVGDALGLPAENLSPSRIQKWWKGEWKMRFVGSRGMISDDTEHTLLVAQALTSSNDAATFQRTLARKLRWWFASLPGGVGLATAKACLKLWVGFAPGNSGVRSGGSGPAMRSAIIGAFFADEQQRRREYVLVSSRLTHKGWQAETTALAVAEAAALAVKHGAVPDRELVLSVLGELSNENEWRECIAQLKDALQQNCPVADFVHKLGLEQGVSGYSLHVVSVALFAWLRHSGDCRAALAAALDCGGDTDTVGAILGALCGASHGATGIPVEWIEGIFEWPRPVGFMRAVARSLAEQKVNGNPSCNVSCFWPGIIPRNIFFLCVVMLHGFRRLFPPY